jgi:16S rRNA (cytosine1402-N4)-methyltransferase
MEYHVPVLAKEALEGLRVTKGNKYIDCTLGDGGHAIEILRAGGKVLGVDYNQESLDRASERIRNAGLEENFIGVLGNFKDIDKLAEENDFSLVNGILYDLGYSSTQLEDSTGLSFQRDQVLDMRLDKNMGVTAADLINSLPEAHLIKLFKEYGEEKYAKRFAHSIVEGRNLKKIETTKDLVDIIVGSSPPGYETGKLHPATKVFQALRIAVNDEFENLKVSLPRAARLLLPGGRMCVISFHSLEDRIVKQFGAGVLSAEGSDVTEVAFMKPGEEEVRGNPRSRSAKLRIIEKNETA